MSFLDIEDILRALYVFNPWWTEIPLKAPSFRRLAFDACLRYLLDPKVERGVLISGPRRVGKTTILLQLASKLLADGHDPRSIVYLSLDHPVLKLLSIEEVIEIYNNRIWPRGQSAFLLLDEVQYSRDWDLHLKVLVDHRKEFRIAATGSAALRQKKDTIDSGVGRWITVPMPTLSFFEFLKIRERAVPDVSPKLRPNHLLEMEPFRLETLARQFQKILPEFQRYLLLGGFPETAKSDDTSYSQRIVREDVVERVIKRDMVALFGVRNINDLEKLFIYLCFHTGGILSLATCASELGVTKTTVANHLEFLEAANLIYKLVPTEATGKKILRRQNKYYLIDAALRNAVLLRGEEVLSDTDELGKIVETSVLRHLYAYYYLDSPEVTYWRESKTKKEVDVIVKSPAYSIPVEVKYKKAAKLTPKDGLAIYASRDEKTKHAYMVTRSDRDFGRVEIEGVSAKLMKIPAHIFMYLLGQTEHSLWEESGRKAPI